MKSKNFFKQLISGMVTGGADNDPSGITTYSLSGARFGFGQLWLMVVATPMLIAVQSMCTRIAHIQRKGLSTVLRDHFSPFVSWTATIILLISNTVTIGADILAVSLAFQMITHISLKIWILPITFFIWYIVLFENYKAIARYLLIMLVFFLSYIVAAFLAHPNWGQVFHSIFLPDFKHFGADYYMVAVAVLGTTITPYLFFWQAKEELEDHLTVAEGKREAKQEDLINAPGFIFSQLITLFIIIAAAVSVTKGAQLLTATDAAKALEPVAGKFAADIFAIGIIGAGLLAIPVLAASSATVVAETEKWRHSSLNDKVHSAKGFYTVISFSLLAGVVILFLKIDPLKAMYYSQVLAGLLAVPLLILIFLLANDKKAMGEYTNKWFDNIFGLLAILVMAGAAVLMFVG